MKAGLVILCVALLWTGQAQAFGVDNMRGDRGSSVMSVASRYAGSNPVGWSHQWCGAYVDLVLRQSGKTGGGNLARGYARYGHPSPCRVGAIAVMSSHVGFVTACNAGSTTIISGNHAGKPGHRVVGYGTYRNSRIIAYRRP